MARALRIGDLVTLPSGKKVRIIVPTDPARPWAAVAGTWLWHVCREHGIPGRPSVSFYFHDKRPMQLGEADAHALAAILNSVQ